MSGLRPDRADSRAVTAGASCAEGARAGSVRSPRRGALGWTVCALVVLLAACGDDRPASDGATTPGDDVAASVPKHLVFVVVENLRADRLGSGVTPRLDQLAAQGAAWERAYSASSSTNQARSALWTGLLPSQGGSFGLDEALPHAGADTLPLLLRRAGFATALAGDASGLRARAFTRGFDALEIDSEPDRWTAADVTSRALELADAAAGERLALFVDYGACEEPYLPSEPFRRAVDVPRPDALLTLAALRASAGELPGDVRGSAGFRDLLARYDAEVLTVDDALGRLVDGLAARGILDDALLVVTSTHGTEFLEHGWVGNGWTLGEEVLRVPLVVRAPGLRPGHLGAPTSLADLAASLRSVFDLGEDPLFGPRPALLSGGPGGLVARDGPGRVIAELVIPELTIQRAVIDDESKLVEVLKWAPPEHRLELLRGRDALIAAMLDGDTERPDPFGASTRRELFDLALDPGESVDQSTSQSARVQALSTWLEGFVASCRERGLRPGQPARRAEPANPDDTERLKQLGYL